MSKLILFQGDSITDAGRNRENDVGTGTGYPTFVKGELGLRGCEMRALSLKPFGCLVFLPFSREGLESSRGLETVTDPRTSRPTKRPKFIKFPNHPHSHFLFPFFLLSLRGICAYYNVGRSKENET